MDGIGRTTTETLAQKSKVLDLSGVVTLCRLIWYTEYGYWYGTGGTTTDHLAKMVPGWEGQNEKSYKCHEFVEAFVNSISKPDSLTFCSETFQKRPFSAAQLLAANKIRYGTKLKSLETLGAVMLHEWGHLINRCTFSTPIGFSGRIFENENANRTSHGPACS